jgi:rare lipoprotein A
MMQHLNVIVVLTIAGLLAACASQQPAPPPPPVATAPAPERPIFTQVGMASWYGENHDGKTTANGETFDMNALTAAHRTLPFGTVVRVTNLATKRMIKVRINDRGPYAEGRIIDLSARAARDLGITDHGVARVRIEQFAADQTAGS